MAQFELNIYGKDDEIIKKFQTDKVRWGFYLQALKVQEEIEGANAAVQFELINGFIKKLFPEITDADLDNADSQDVLNTFTQLLRKANAIKGAEPKNSTGAVAE